MGRLSPVRGAAPSGRGRVATLEVNAASLPIYNIGSDEDGSWQVSTVYRGQPLTAIGIGPLTMRDALLLAALDTRYVADDTPADRWVTFTLPEARSWMGYQGRGGKSNQLVLGSLRRIADVAVKSVVWGKGGLRASRTWRFVDVVEEGARPRAGSLVRVRLSDVHVSLLREGPVTVFDIPTFGRLLDRNPLAARLWVILEADSGPAKLGGWHYRLWRAERAPHRLSRPVSGCRTPTPRGGREGADGGCGHRVGRRPLRRAPRHVTRSHGCAPPSASAPLGTGDQRVRELGTGGYGIEHEIDPTVVSLLRVLPSLEPYS